MLSQREIEWLQAWKMQVGVLIANNNAMREELEEKMMALRDEGSRLDRRMTHIHGLLTVDMHDTRDATNQHAVANLATQRITEDSDE